MLRWIADDQAAAPATRLVTIPILQIPDPTPEILLDLAVPGRRVNCSWSGATVGGCRHREHESRCEEVRDLESSVVVAVGEDWYLSHEGVGISSGSPLLSKHGLRYADVLTVLSGISNQYAVSRAGLEILAEVPRDVLDGVGVAGNWGHALPRLLDPDSADNVAAMSFNKIK